MLSHRFHPVQRRFVPSNGFSSRPQEFAERHGAFGAYLISSNHDLLEHRILCRRHRLYVACIFLPIRSRACLVNRPARAAFRPDREFFLARIGGWGYADALRRVQPMNWVLAPLQRQS